MLPRTSPLSGISQIALCLFASLSLHLVRVDAYDWKYVPPASVGRLRFENVTINLLLPDFIANGLSGSGTLFKDRIARFCNETGAAATITAKAFPTAYRAELEYDLDSGLNFYDAFNFFGSWMPGLVVKGHLLQLTDYVKRAEHIEWSDILPSVRRGVAEFQNQIYMLPADGDVIVMIYRQDLLDLHGLAKPETWEDWLAVSKYFRKHVGPDAWTAAPNRTLGQEGGYGACMMTKRNDWAYANLFAFLATYLQAHGPSQGIFFDPVTMEPLFDTPAAREALILYKEIVLHSSHSERPCQKCTDDGGAGLFTMVEDMQNGRCMMGFNYMGPVKFIASGAFNTANSTIALAPVPGSTRAKAAEGTHLVECGEAPSNCPFASDVPEHDSNGRLVSGGGTRRVNRATYYSGGGQSWAISGHIDDARKRDAVMELLLSFIDKDNAILSTTAADYLLDPFRQSTLDGLQVAGHVATDKFMENNWKWEQLGTMKATLQTVFTDPNSVLDLKIVQGGSYIEETDASMLKYFQGILDVDQVIAEMTELWRTRTQALGRQEQRNLYRSVLGLAAIYDQLNCSAGSQHVLGRCELCAPGTYKATGGPEACRACEVGRYAATSGSSACAACPDPLHKTFKQVTLAGALKWVYADGADSSGSCGCDMGTQLNREGSCVPCMSPGLLCAGMGQVTVEPGYASDGELSVYRCLAEPLACPGGEVGLCGRGRLNASIACSQCEPWTAPAEDGSCRPCSSGDQAPFFVFVIAVSCVLVGLYYMNDRDKKAPSSLSALLIATLLSQMTSVVQQLGVVGMIAVDWAPPLKSLLMMVRIFIFDIDIVRSHCILNSSPLVKFCLSNLVVIVSILFILLLHATFVVCKHRGKFSERRPSLVASVGSVLLSFFLAILATTVSCFQCNGHPNGKQSLHDYPSILCWEGGEHDDMIAVGAACAFIPIGFFAAAVWAVSRVSREMIKGNEAFLQSWAFLIFRFRPEACWFAPCLLLRNALIAVGPMFVNPFNQILWTHIVLTASLLLVTRCLPWKAGAANGLDVCGHLSVLVIISLAAFHVDVQDSGFVSTVAFACFLAFFLLLPLGIVIAAYRIIQNRKKPFQFFICHHKAGAGAFARWMKVRLSRTSGVTRRIWLDSDDLKDLDMLFDYVAMSDNFIVILSEEVLTRPWCIGETTTAHLNGVRTTLVALPQCSFPENEFIDNYESYVSQLDCLIERHITVRMIKDALHWLRGKPHLRLPDRLDVPVFRSLCTKLASSTLASETLPVLADPTVMTPKSATFILANHSSTEAVATAHILRDLVVAYMAHESVRVLHVLSHHEDIPQGLSDMVIVCTDGIFMQRNILKALTVGARNSATVLPIIGNDSFRFPSPALLKEIWPVLDVFYEEDRSSHPDAIAKVILGVFKEIAIVFAPADYSSTELILDAKAKEIASRLMTKTRQRLSGWDDAICN